MDFALDRASSAALWIQYNVILNTVGLALLVALTPPAGRLGKLLFPCLAGVSLAAGVVGLAIWRNERVAVLALAVLVISLIAMVDRIRRFAPFRWVVTAVAILFIPNAAYSMTHGVHWVVDLNARATEPAMLYIAGIEYAAYVAYSMLVLQAGLWTITHRVQSVTRRIAVTGIVLFLSSLAVYIGRMERFNSWDPITNPEVLQDMVATLAPVWQLWVATLAYTAMTLAVVVCIPRLIGSLHLLRGEPIDDRLPALDAKVARKALWSFGVLWIISAGGYISLWWLAPALTKYINPPISDDARTVSIAIGAALLIIGVVLAAKVSDRSFATRSICAIVMASIFVLGGVSTFWIAHESCVPRHKLGLKYKFRRHKETDREKKAVMAGRIGTRCGLEAGNAIAPPPIKN